MDQLFVSLGDRLPGGHVGRTPPARLMLSRGLRVWRVGWFALSLRETGVFEHRRKRPEENARELLNRGLLGASLAAPGPQEAFLLIPLSLPPRCPEGSWLFF